jgi:membrane associated rhomboid family serine protease
MARMASSANSARRPPEFSLPGGQTLQPPNATSRVPILNTAPAIRWITCACILVQILMIVLPGDLFITVIDRFAFFSVRYTYAGAWELDPLAYAAAPLSYMYLHGGLTHLFINLAMLLAFGTAIARRMSGLSFLVFYTFCGVFGAISWMLFHPNSIDPLLGASGAISGMVGAVGRISMGHPDTHSMPFRSRNMALAFVAVWLVLNFVFGVIGGELFGLEGEVAWEAHLGGFIAGLVLVPLFSRDRHPHWR